ncbi:MAG: hypothetical protein ABI442_06105 [Gemmatimonadaceae bacterium]
MSRRLSAGLALFVLASACGGGGSSTTTPAALTVVYYDGAGETAAVGQALSASPGAKVTVGSTPSPNVAVTFAVVSGGGSITGRTVTSGADGIARPGAWTLGTTAGANTMTATVSGAVGSPVTFTATGRPGPASVVTKVSGDGITSVAGVPVANKPTVKVADSFGNGITGLTVVFAPASGSGTVTGGATTTGTDGTAQVGAWIISPTIGPNTLVATASGTGLAGNPTTFTITGVASTVASITKSPGTISRPVLEPRR